MALFIVCWSPLQLFTMVAEFVPTILLIESDEQYKLFVYGYLGSHLMAMAHSLVNPVVYCFISRNFRVMHEFTLKVLKH